MSTVSIKGNKSKKKVISSLEGSHRHRNKNQQEGVIVTMIGNAAEAGKIPQARPYKGGDVDYSLTRTALRQ